MEFQRFFERILSFHEPTFTPIKPSGPEGDWKCDGWIPTSGTVFQCYAPESDRSQAAVRKLQEDFSGAMRYWGDRMRRWVFVYSARNALFAPIAATLADLQRNHPELRIESWGREDLWEIVKKLPLAHRETLFGVVPRINSVTESGVPEIQVLLKHLHRSGMTSVDSGTRLLDITEKISLNRLGPTIRAFLEPSFTLVGMVEQYLARHPDPEFNRGVSQALVLRYAELEAKHPDEPDRVFFGLILWIQAQAGVHEGDAALFWASTAIVSHYFELCDIFRS